MITAFLDTYKPPVILIGRLTRSHDARPAEELDKRGRKEKALKEVVEDTMHERSAVLEAVEGRARDSEVAYTLDKQRAVDLEAK